MTVQTDAAAARLIFTAALKLPDGTSRREYLASVCGDDAALRQQVEALLAASDQDQQSPLHQAAERAAAATPGQDPATTDTFITNAPDEEAFNAAPPLDVAKQPQIGPYKIREQIGEGGMGYVYVAEQTKPVRRKVAMKVIKPGMDTKEVVARFEAERQALAMMSHPHIAKVLDGGATETGRPYFVMELVRGVPITQFCDEQKLSTRERLELFLPVCQAVQHAHMKGIIHRDLKPSNVIVELDDVRPVPKVIDFGVAKATGQQLSNHTVYTQFSQLVGTPLYMSPEQAKQSSTDIDTRSDIYSLGVLLYELLTGTTPFDKSTLSSVDATELRRIICEDDPPRPSARVSTLKNEQLSTISTSRKTEPKQLSLSLQRELDWIVMKSLEKDRTRRYDSASALAVDIQRYLDDEPVEACPPTVGYRLKKLYARHRAWLTMVAVVLFMLVTSTIVSGVFAVAANDARERSEASEQQATDALETARQEKQNAERASSRAERNSAQMMEALQQLLAHVGNPVLAELPKVQGLRQEILHDTLTFFERVSIEDDTSVDVRFRAASVYSQVARLIYDDFHYAEAIRSYEKGLVLIDQLVTEYPKRTDYRALQAELQWKTGGVYFSARDHTRATDYLQRAIESYQRLQLMEPGSKEYRILEGQARGKLAHQYEYTAPDDPRFAKLVNRAYDLVGEDDPAARASILRMKGVLAAQSDPEEADWYYREAVAIARGIPIVTKRDRHWQAWYAYKIAPHFSERFPEEAEALFLEAIDRAQTNVREFPSIDRFHSQLNSLVQSYVAFLVSQGRREDAQAFFADVLQEHPDDLPMHVARAKFERKSPNAGELLTASIEEYPRTWPYYHERGAMHLQNERYEPALDNLNRAVDLLSKTETGRGYILPYRTRGGLYERTGELANAAKDLSRAIEIDHKAADYRQRARIWFRMGDYAKVVPDLQSAIDRHSDAADALSVIPMSEIADCPSDEFRGAYLAFINEELDNSHESAEMLIVRARYRLALGQLELAISDLQKVAVQPDVPYDSHYQLALLNLQLDNLVAFRLRCQKTLAAFRDSERAVETHFAAWTCALRPEAVDDYDPAIKLARQALELEPENQQYLDGLGAILMRAGQYGEAKVTLDEALEAPGSENTSTSYIRYFLAMTEHHLGNTEAAQEQLAAANASAEKELAGDPAWNRKVTLELLRKEAEKLIDGDGAGASN